MLYLRRASVNPISVQCTKGGTKDCMSTGKLKIEDLGKLVRTERLRQGISLREAAEKTDIPFNTLARVEKGHIPDLTKFKRLVEWCGADINQFFETPERVGSTTDVIAEHLYADQNLPPEAASQIAGIVHQLYQALARPQEVAAAHLKAATTFDPQASRALGSLIQDLNVALIRENENGAA